MDTFTALADPTRRRIVELLAHRGRLSATQIAEHFQISAPAISQHLKILREANVVVMEKRAQQRIYQLNPATLSEFEGWVRRLKEEWEQRFSALDEVLRAEQAKMDRNDPHKGTGASND